MTQPSGPFEYSIEHRLFAPSGEPPMTESICCICEDPIERTMGSRRWHHVVPADSVHDAEAWEDEGSSFTPEGDPAGGVVYLCEGRQLGYGTKDAWNA